jgi:hypothetical protein
MTRQKPVYCDSGAISDRPLFVPPGKLAPLHGADARIAATWLMRWCRRKKIPLSPSATRKLRHIRLGRQEFREREWLAIMKYAQRVLRQREQRATATLQLRGAIFGGGLLRLTR